ncbi:MAG: hypothetical protein ACSHX6_15525 [Akkermansiaceae bacterium]
MRFLIPVIVSASLASCGHIFTKSDTYDTSSAVTINGAKVSSGVKPMGGDGGMALSAMIYMAGSAKLEGPFIWRIEAEGEADEHTRLVVHRLKVETSKTNRKEWYPEGKLGEYVKFINYKREPGKSYAVYHIPGKLSVFPDKDGDIIIFADVTISSKTDSERKVVKFSLPAEQNKKEKEFIFFPAEIVKGFGQRDPREWGF